MAFLGFRIYRRKFLITAAVVLLLSTAVFCSILIFFLCDWTSNLEQEAQRLFWKRERRLSEIEGEVLDYVSGLYGSEALMADTEALFLSEDEARYLERRRRNSLSSSVQIRYLPADLKSRLMDSSLRIVAVTLRSEKGEKTVRPMGAGVSLRFSGGSADPGEILAASFSVREPGHMGRSMGTMDFWVSGADLYEREEGLSAAWALLSAEGQVLQDGGLTVRERDRIQRAAAADGSSGWFWEGAVPVFYLRMASEESDYRYVAAKGAGAVLGDNLYVLIALSCAFVLIDVGVLASGYAGLRSDESFLSVILAMLSDMEGGDFEKMRRQALPARHRENEYGMIAAALKDMGKKLEGYIETEYILKLKEQETQMRALQHQINPHFLYNTLEVLRSKALTCGDRDMADAIAMLGSLYRTRMHKKESILLREEFALLEMYLKIMALRYGDRFVYQMELEEAVGEMETVTFWLQPLAENFFAHGFDRESEYNLLIVSGRAGDGGALIEIMDNGTGAESGKLPEIRRNMHEGSDGPEEDIGLRNVYMRLRYFYREGFRMDVGNREEGGFSVSLFLPTLSGRTAGKRGEEDAHV